MNYYERYIECTKCKSRCRQSITMPITGLGEDMISYFERGFRREHDGKRCRAAVKYSNWKLPNPYRNS